MPGTYEYVGHDSRDVLILAPDGSYSRKAVYRGVTQTQTGRWRAIPARPAGWTYIAFDHEAPTCLLTTRRADAFFLWTEPNETLCGPTALSFLDVGGHVAISAGEDEGFLFIRR